MENLQIKQTIEIPENMEEWFTTNIHQETFPKADDSTSVHKKALIIHTRVDNNSVESILKVTQGGDGKGYLIKYMGKDIKEAVKVYNDLKITDC